MRHTLEARERALVAGSSYAPKFGYVIAMVVAAVLMRSPSARASDVPPEQIRTTAEMEAAINQQVARYEPAVLAVRRTKAALPPLQAAHQQMLTENMPWWERKADYKGRLSQLDEHERLRAITELAPELARQEAELLRRKQSLEAAGRPMPAEETRSWELYRSVKAEVDKAQRELPRARPAWVPSGTDVAAFRATLAQEFERFTAQLRPRQEEMDRRAAALSAAAYAATRAQQDAIEVRRRYLVLRHELQRRLAPAYVSEVKLRAPLDPRGNEATYYHAVIDNPETEGLNPGTVAMMAAMPAVDAEVLRALDEFREAERRFVSVSAQWQRKNDLYIVITRDEYILNTGLELAESMTAIASDGFSPTAVFFELGVRLKDAYKGESAVSEPTLSEELRAYRNRVTGALATTPVPAAATTSSPPTYGPSLVPPPVALPSSVVPGETGPQPRRFLDPLEEMRREIAKHETLSVTSGDIASNQFWEAVEGTVGTAFGAACTKLADKISLNRFTADMPAIMAAYALEGNFSGDAAQFIRNVTSRRDVLLGAVAARPGESMLQKLREPANLKDIGKGFALGAALSVTKDGVKNIAGFAAERTRLVTDMALLDIEWFVRRAEYQTKGQIYRGYRAMQASYKAQLAEEYDRQVSVPRRLRVLVDKPFATFDHVEANLVFTGLVRDVDVRSAASEYSSSLDDKVRETFAIRLFGGKPEPGQTPLFIQARGDASSFDGDPITPPRYAGPTLERPAPTPSLWSGVERVRDGQHRIRTEAPTLTLADPPSGRPYIPGDRVGVAYHLPGSLPYQQVKLSTADGENEVTLPAQADGRAQVLLREGESSDAISAIVSPRGDRSRRIAHLPVTIATPATRTLPGGPGRVTQKDLPSRGPWLEPEATPIRAGLGRLLFERRDAGAQLLRHRVDIHVAGAATAQRSSWDAEVELPPGAYDARFYRSPEYYARGVVVKLGETTRVVGPPSGRLTIHQRGGKVGRVIVKQPGTENMVDQAWGATFDLPAGRYDLEIYTGAVEPLKQAGVSVTLGTLTTVEVPGGP